MDFDQLKDAEERGFNPHAHTTVTGEFTPFEIEQDYPDELAPGVVVGFMKRYREDGPAYGFAAVRVARKGWYLTGPNYAGKPMTWHELLDFVGGPDEWRQVGVCMAWTPLVPR